MSDDVRGDMGDDQGSNDAAAADDDDDDDWDRPSTYTIVVCVKFD